MKFKIDSSGKIVSRIYPPPCSLDKYSDYLDGDIPEWATHYIGGEFRFQKSEEEARVDALIRRSGMLKDSDWTQLPDVPLETKTAWATYRQQLRDITNQAGYPFDIEWPVSPLRQEQSI